MMKNVFEPVRVKGKLMGKNVATGQFATKDQIRHIQLLNAEKNREVLFVSATGRVTRVPAAEAGVATTPPPVMKMSFLQAKESQCPEEMFQNIERLTKMVGRGIQPSLVITGGAGTGKTHLVKSTLEGMGLTESTDFVHFKGRATAAGLFVTLYENSDKIIVLDDCDSVFKDDDAVNILKGALDSYDTRKISYISTKSLKFTRMSQLANKMESRIPQAAKDQALELMKELDKEFEGVEVNLRSFIKAARICAMGFDNPKMMIAEQIIPA